MKRSACALLSNLAACASTQTVDLVLTFDDGPVSADIARTEATERSGDELLGPMHDILTTLEARGIEAVFFVEGPGTEEAALNLPLRNAHRSGWLDAKDGGHVLGYHAFDHSTSVWGPLTPTDADAIAADLRTLASFIDEALEEDDLTQEELFAPLFRQPFGGGGAAGEHGQAAATMHGWTVRGFAIDSVDWTTNSTADPAFAEALELACEEARDAYVARRLEQGASSAENAVIDVLFHVNAFTAEHLDDWLPVLESALEDAGADEIRWRVPEHYLSETDTFVDRTFVSDALPSSDWQAPDCGGHAPGP